MFETSIESAQVEKLNLDFECFYDIITEKGIRINSVKSFDKKGEKIYNGLQSPFFAKDFQDDHSFNERWSCKCKKLVGEAYNGMICDSCLTIVEYNDIDLEKFGWVMVDHFKVISPIYVAKINSALGSSNGEFVLSKIIKNDFGEKEKTLSEKEKLEEKIHPFMRKGMNWFRANIDEVLAYYAKKKPTKAALFEELRNDKSNIFTGAIPVYSSILRSELPGEKDKKVFKMRVNSLYQSMIRSSNEINHLGNPDNMDEDELNTVDRYLSAMHEKIVELFEEIFKLLNGKKGIINGKVIAGRYNFSCRNIIVPSGIGLLKTDEVELCYISFMELYRYELINLYSKINDCTIMESQNAWKRATVHFSQTFYNLMNHIIENNPKLCNVIINRNPSINVGSFMAMKVIRVKPDINDKTLTIANSILVPMAGDYDGDCYNIFRIIGMDFGKKFMKNMNPRYNLNIDRVNGRVNMDLMPSKDDLTGFWQFCNL